MYDMDKKGRTGTQNAKRTNALVLLACFGFFGAAATSAAEKSWTGLEGASTEIVRQYAGEKFPEERTIYVKPRKSKCHSAKDRGAWATADTSIKAAIERATKEQNTREDKESNLPFYIAVKKGVYSVKENINIKNANNIVIIGNCRGKSSTFGDCGTRWREFENRHKNGKSESYVDKETVIKIQKEKSVNIYNSENIYIGLIKFEGNGSWKKINKEKCASCSLGALNIMKSKEIKLDSVNFENFKNITAVDVRGSSVKSLYMIMSNNINKYNGPSSLIIGGKKSEYSDVKSFWWKNKSVFPGAVSITGCSSAKFWGSEFTENKIMGEKTMKSKKTTDPYKRVGSAVFIFASSEKENSKPNKLIKFDKVVFKRNKSYYGGSVGFMRNANSEFNDCTFRDNNHEKGGDIVVSINKVNTSLKIVVNRSYFDDIYNCSDFDLDINSNNFKFDSSVWKREKHMENSSGWIGYTSHRFVRTR